MLIVKTEESKINGFKDKSEFFSLKSHYKSRWTPILCARKKNKSPEAIFKL